MTYRLDSLLEQITMLIDNYDNASDMFKICTSKASLKAKRSRMLKKQDQGFTTVEVAYFGHEDIETIAESRFTYHY